MWRGDLKPTRIDLSLSYILLLLKYIFSFTLLKIITFSSSFSELNDGDRGRSKWREGVSGREGVREGGRKAERRGLRWK